MTIKKRKKENKYKKTGQGNLEALLLVIVLVLIIKGGFMLFWLVAGNLWLDHQLYQHLICRAKGHSEIFCEKKLLKEVRKFTWIGAVENMESIHLNNSWMGSLSWKMGGISVPIKQVLELP